MGIALVYMVAGMSSRFGGKIKQFAKVGPNGETLIEYSLNQAIKAGFEKIFFVVGNLTEKPFKEKFGNSYKGIPVYYALQKFDLQERDKPWGTVDAVCAIKEIIDCPFVVCNGDDIYGEKTFKILFEHLKENKTSASIGKELIDMLPEKGTVCRGIFKLGSDGEIKSLKEFHNISKENLFENSLEKNAPTNLNMFGFHLKDLEGLNKRLEKFKEKHKGDRKAECLLPDEISKLIENKELEMKFYFSPEKWFGVTNSDDEEIVREQLKRIG